MKLEHPTATNYRGKILKILSNMEVNYIMKQYIQSSNAQPRLTQEQFAMRIIDLGLRHGIPDTEMRQYYGNTLVNKFFASKAQQTIN